MTLACAEDMHLMLWQQENSLIKMQNIEKMAGVMKKDIRELLKEALRKKTCIEYAVAAVIETLDSICVLGWNGPPQGIAHTECFLKKEQGLNGQYLCPAVHSERRAISRAAKGRQ